MPPTRLRAPDNDQDLHRRSIGATATSREAAVGEGPVIVVRGLRMSYGPVDAVCGIDLEVGPGEVFAFLGPNGAGKTTTVEILEGFRHRTAGEVSVLGMDPGRAGGEWRARIGVVLQESEPEPELTVVECMSLYAGYYPRSRPIGETLDLVGLSDRYESRCGQLSGGQRRRLDLALALVGDPDLLFLDEPTTGFDPSARRAAWEVISGLRDLGKTILLTTHYMEEADHLADRIAVISKGEIVASGSAASLGERARKASAIRFTLPPGMVVADLPPMAASAVTAFTDSQVELQANSPLSVVGVLAAWARERRVDLPDLEVTRPTLEDIYLELTELQP
jgi:ABC-2 type transport system ATP-binding protein